MGHERGDYTTMNEEKKLNMPQSLLLLLLIIGSVAVCIRLKTGGPMDHHLFILQSIENQL